MLIDLRDFLATGQFGPVPFGCSRRRLEAILGQPEATGGETCKHRRPSIWKYGDVEFFFPKTRDRVEGDRLEMVHIDRFNGPDRTPQGWGELSVEPWVVREEATLAEFADALKTAGLAYTVRHKPEWNQEIIVMASAVEVRFVCTPDEFSGFVGLFAISRRVDGGAKV